MKLTHFMVNVLESLTCPLLHVPQRLEKLIHFLRSLAIIGYLARPKRDMSFYILDNA